MKKLLKLITLDGFLSIPTVIIFFLIITALIISFIIRYFDNIAFYDAAIKILRESQK